LSPIYAAFLLFTTSLIPAIKPGIDHRSMDGDNHRLEFGLQTKVKVLISSQRYGTYGTVPCTLIITESFRQEEMSCGVFTERCKEGDSFGGFS
jgi:hypothetical protein